MLTLRFFFPSVYIPRVLRINLFKQANQKDELWCLVGYCAWPRFQQYFSFIVAVSFIGGGNRSTSEKTTELLYGDQINVAVFI
jgi:hypothetical protein